MVTKLVHTPEGSFVAHVLFWPVQDQHGTSDWFMVGTTKSKLKNRITGWYIIGQRMLTPDVIEKCLPRIPTKFIPGHFYTQAQNFCPRWPIYKVKWLCSRWQKWKREGCYSHQCQYLILMTWRACDLNLVMISSLASKWQVLKVGMPIFQPFYEMKLKTSEFKVLAFWSHISWPNF